MTYDESILDTYGHLPNKRFLDDHISLRTQRRFGIGYDTESNRITIPVRNEVGELIGVKGRRNDDFDEYGPKYLYLIPAQSSLTLYGYSSNYEYLYNDLVILTESEKSVMQAYSYHCRNVVALSGDAVSDKQVKLIHQLSPAKIVVALDSDLEDKYTNKIINALTSYHSMSSAEIWRWDSKNTPNIENKSSLTDAGKEKFLDILENNLIRLV